MTDKPTVASTADADATQPDASLPLRRIMVWVLAVILAILSAVFVMQIGVSLIWPNNGQIPLGATIPISFVNIPLLPIAAIPMTLFWMIWLDFALRTHILRD